MEFKLKEESLQNIIDTIKSNRIKKPIGNFWTAIQSLENQLQKIYSKGRTFNSYEESIAALVKDIDDHNSNL